MLKKEEQLKDLLERDFKKMQVTAETAVELELARHLYLQEVAANARNGDSLFQRRRFPNVTIDDVVQALKIKPEKLKTERQRMINEFLSWLDYILNDNTKEKLVNESGKPLFMITPLLKYKVDPKEVLRGIYLWSSIQQKDIIEAAEKRYGRNIGRGMYYLIDMQQLGKHGIDADDLEHFSHEDMVDFYREIKIITNQEKIWKMPEGKIKYLFIRHSLGSGISPDLGILLAGVIYSKDAALGVLLSQVLDTLSKYVHQYNEYNDDVCRSIKLKFKDLDIDDDELLSFLNLVVMPDDENRDHVPASTVLDLFIVDRKSGVYPFETYMAFIDHKPVVPTYIGKNRILSLDFFRYVNKLLLESRVVDTERPQDYLKLSRDLPAKELATDKYVVIRSDEPISTGIKKMIQTGKDILIIINENGKLVGVMHSSDIVRLFEN